MTNEKPAGKLLNLTFIQTVEMSIRVIESGKSIQIVRQIIVERAMKTNLVDSNVQRYLIATKMERKQLEASFNLMRTNHCIVLLLLYCRYSIAIRCSYDSNDVM